jgi:hypothetical protein
MFDMIRSVVPSLLLPVLLIVSVPAPAEEQTAADPAQGILRQLGFDPDDALPRLRKGEILSEERGAAVAVAVMMNGDLDAIARWLQGEELLLSNREVRAFGLIAAPYTDAVFQPVRLDPQEEADWIDALFSGKPSRDVNLSTEELQGFAALQDRFEGTCSEDPACVAEVNRLFREVLLARTKAYLRGGLDAIAPYAREGGKSLEPGAALRADAEAVGAIGRALPGFQKNYLDYAGGDLAGTGHELAWLQEVTGGQRNYVLSHRFYRREPGGVIVAERQFYVGRFYDAFEAVLAGIPTQDGILLCFRARPTPDGGVGGKKLTSVITARLKELRKTVGGK